MFETTSPPLVLSWPLVKNALNMCIYDYAEKNGVVKSVICAVLSSSLLSKEAKPIRNEKYPRMQPGKHFPQITTAEKHHVL